MKTKKPRGERKVKKILQFVHYNGVMGFKPKTKKYGLLYLTVSPKLIWALTR